MQPKKKEGVMLLGIISLVTVLTVLIFTCFGFLSYFTARSDLRLAERMAASQKKEFAAQSEAAQILSSIDENLKKGEISGTDGASITVYGETVSFSVLVDEHRSLYVEARMSENSIKEIIFWKTVDLEVGAQ